MATTSDVGPISPDLLDRCEEFLRSYYREEIGRLAEHYPQERRSLTIHYDDLFQFDPNLADDWVNEEPETIQTAFEDALGRVDLPIDIADDFDQAHVRLGDLPDTHTVYPDSIEPTSLARSYRAVTGDVLVSTDAYAKVTVADFECQRCGSHTTIPQGDEWQEPHQCQGCEREGPFEIDYERSEFVDGQTIQLQTPPERAAGAGRTLQVFVEDDLCGQVAMGDRITVSGTIRLDQQTRGSKQCVEFNPYLEGQHITIEDGTTVDLDLDSETRQRIEALAAGEHGDPLDLAAQSLNPKIHGHETIKQALILTLVGGATQTTDLRGEFHTLLIGDPSTGKSDLVEAAADIAPRAVEVSAANTTSAGLTTTATQGEFSDGRWTLQPGAFVKANEGVVAIDELDDLPPDDRKSMLEPMANQRLNVSKAGITATLRAQTAVIAAANPEGARFDPYEELTAQFGFESNLISRFDLVFTFEDQPDPDRDAAVADHTTQYRDDVIRRQQGDGPEESVADRPVDTDTLTQWLALAKRQPDPVYADDSVREHLSDAFVTLRGANGYDGNAEVPVTFRKLPGVERVARAAAKLELSATVEQRHADLAMDLVGQSMQDYMTDADGDLDADIAETGTSTSQRARKEQIAETIQRLQREGDSDRADIEHVVDALAEDYPPNRIRNDIQRFKDKGAAYEPMSGFVRWVGGH